MSRVSLRTYLLPVLALLGLTACGGSGGGGTTTAGGGIGGTGISFGAVVDFGSVIVNGTRFDDSNASVTLDDNPGAGTHGGLKQGMVVKVTGSYNGTASTASSIAFRDNLEGPVCADDPTTVPGIRTLRVLGQTVILDATTIVDNDNATISVGDIVEVSGLPDDQERIRASFIEKKTPQTAVIEVKGRVDAVNGLISLAINALDVDISTAMIDNSIPGGQPAVGQFVEVKGTTFDCGDTRDTLMATSVELEPEGAGAIGDGVRAEIEGFITEVSGGGFKVGNQPVVTTGATVFLPDDFSAADIAVGAKVEAEGTLVNGVLTATKISFRENVKLESDIASGGDEEFTLVGLPGITVRTDANTEFKDNIRVIAGAHVRVRGIEGPDNTVLATRIESQNGSTVFLQGTVDTVADPSITILAVAVDTSSIVEFEDVNDNPIPRATFFGRVQLGTLVKIKGDLAMDGTSVIWGEAELED